MGQTNHLRWEPTAIPVRRGSGQVQFGFDPDHGIILSGLADGEVLWLLQLPLTHDDTSLHRSARHHHVPAQRRDDLLNLLRHHGILQSRTTAGDHGAARRGPASAALIPPAPSEQRPVVHVFGRGHVADVIVEYLTDLGVPKVERAPLHPHPSAELAELAVVVDREILTPTLRAIRARARLPVLVRRREITVGPMVHQRGRPCLNCLDSFRRVRDSCWPRLSVEASAAALIEPFAQLPTGRPELAENDPILGAAMGVVTSSVTAPPDLIAAAAAMTTRIVDLHVRGAAAPPGVSWEWTTSWPAVRLRRWPADPDCACADHGDRVLDV